MSSDPSADQPAPTAYWPLDEHIIGALAEALVAEHQHRIGASVTSEPPVALARSVF